MKKPTLQEFGISEAEWNSYLEDRKADLVEKFWLVWLYSYGFACGIITILLFLKGLRIGFMEVFAIVFNGAWVSLPLCGLFSSIRSKLRRYLLSKKYQQIYKFNNVLSDFNHWWVRTQKEFWLSLNGRQFEHQLAKFYKNQGYSVRVSTGGGDGGIDITMSKDGRHTIVQCKAHKSSVGPHVVRDLYGTLVDMRADEAILASLSGFTKGARQFASGKPIKLIELSDIISMQIKEYESNPIESLGN